MNSQQQFRAGEARGQGQALADDWLQSAQDSTHAARDKMANAAASTENNSQAAQQRKEETASFLQQKGEQMMHMAQGAVDTVKSTLGVGDNSTNTKK